MRYSAVVARKLERDLRRVLLETVSELGTQAKVAEELGVDQATVSRWVSGSQGMEIGQCLLFAKMTNTPLADVMRWAHHDPDRYLESSALPPLSAESQSIADRVRVLGWERTRRTIPEKFRPLVDRVIDTVLSSYTEACDLADD